MKLEDLKNPVLIKDQLIEQNGHGVEFAAAIGNLLAILGHQSTTFELLRVLEEDKTLTEHVEVMKREHIVTRKQLYQR